jgi:hypothetical protein
LSNLVPTGAHLYGKRIKGVLVLRPAEYFDRRRQA